MKITFDSDESTINNDFKDEIMMDIEDSHSISTLISNLTGCSILGLLYGFLMTILIAIIYIVIIMATDTIDAYESSDLLSTDKFLMIFIFSISICIIVSCAMVIKDLIKSKIEYKPIYKAIMSQNMTNKEFFDAINLSKDIIYDRSILAKYTTYVKLTKILNDKTIDIKCKDKTIFIKKCLPNGDIDTTHIHVDKIITNYNINEPEIRVCKSYDLCYIKPYGKKDKHETT